MTVYSNKELPRFALIAPQQECRNGAITKERRNWGNLWFSTCVVAVISLARGTNSCNTINLKIRSMSQLRAESEAAVTNCRLVRFDRFVRLLPAPPALAILIRLLPTSLFLRPNPEVMSLQGSLSIKRMCQLAQVSRAGFYRSLQERLPMKGEMEVRSTIQQIVLEHRRRYGYRRVTAELRRRGMLVNHKRVARLMREDNLLTVQPRAFVVTTDSKHEF